MSSLSSLESTSHGGVAVVTEQQHSPPPQQQQQQHPQLRRRRQSIVRFDEEKNQYLYLEPVALDYETKSMLWYNGSDFQYFHSHIWTCIQELQQQQQQQQQYQKHQEQQTTCWDALGDAYRTTTTNNQNNKNKNLFNNNNNEDEGENDWKQRLARVYQQTDELVGLELYVMLPECREDIVTRKQALRGAVRFTEQSSSKQPRFDRGRRCSSSNKERHLSLLSQKLSKKSLQFVHNIAIAQSQALRNERHRPQQLTPTNDYD